MKKSKGAKHRKAKKLLGEIAAVVPSILKKIEDENVFKEGNAIMKMIDNLSQKLPELSIRADALAPANRTMSATEAAPKLETNKTQPEKANSPISLASETESKKSSASISLTNDTQSEKSSTHQSLTNRTKTEKATTPVAFTNRKEPEKANTSSSATNKTMSEKSTTLVELRNITQSDTTTTPLPLTNNLLAEDNMTEYSMNRMRVAPTNPSNNRESLMLDVYEGPNVVNVKNNVSKGDIIGELAHFIPSLLKKLQGAEVIRHGKNIVSLVDHFSQSQQPPQQQQPQPQQNKQQRNSRSVYEETEDDEDDEDEDLKASKRWNKNKQKQEDGMGWDEDLDDDEKQENATVEYADNSDDVVDIKPHHFSSETDNQLPLGGGKKRIEEIKRENLHRLKTLRLEQFLSDQLPGHPVYKNHRGYEKDEGGMRFKNLDDLRVRLHGWMKDTTGFKKGSIPQDVFDEYVSQGVEYMTRHLKNSSGATFTSIFPIHFNRSATHVRATPLNKYFTGDENDEQDKQEVGIRHRDRHLRGGLHKKDNLASLGFDSDEDERENRTISHIKLDFSTISLSKENDSPSASGEDKNLRSEGNNSTSLLNPGDYTDIKKNSKNMSGAADNASTALNEGKEEFRNNITILFEAKDLQSIANLGENIPAISASGSAEVHLPPFEDPNSNSPPVGTSHFTPSAVDSNTDSTVRSSNDTTNDNQKVQDISSKSSADDETNQELPKSMNNSFVSKNNKSINAMESLPLADKDVKIPLTSGDSVTNNASTNANLSTEANPTFSEAYGEDLKSQPSLSHLPSLNDLPLLTDIPHERDSHAEKDATNASVLPANETNAVPLQDNEKKQNVTTPINSTTPQELDPQSETDSESSSDSTPAFTSSINDNDNGNVTVSLKPSNAPSVHFHLRNVSVPNELLTRPSVTSSFNEEEDKGNITIFLKENGKKEETVEGTSVSAETDDNKDNVTIVLDMKTLSVLKEEQPDTALQNNHTSDEASTSVEKINQLSDDDDDDDDDNLPSPIGNSFEHESKTVRPSENHLNSKTMNEEDHKMRFQSHSLLHKQHQQHQQHPQKQQEEPQEYSTAVVKDDDQGKLDKPPESAKNISKSMLKHSVKSGTVSKSENQDPDDDDEIASTEEEEAEEVIHVQPTKGDLKKNPQILKEDDEEEIAKPATPSLYLAISPRPLNQPLQSTPLKEEQTLGTKAYPTQRAKSESQGANLRPSKRLASDQNSENQDNDVNPKMLKPTRKRIPTQSHEISTPMPTPLRQILNQLSGTNLQRLLLPTASTTTATHQQMKVKGSSFSLVAPAILEAKKQPKEETVTRLKDSRGQHIPETTKSSKFTPIHDNDPPEPKHVSSSVTKISLKEKAKLLPTFAPSMIRHTKTKHSSTFSPTESKQTKKPSQNSDRAESILKQKQSGGVQSKISGTGDKTHSQVKPTSVPPKGLSIGKSPKNLPPKKIIPIKKVHEAKKNPSPGKAAVITAHLHSTNVSVPKEGVKSSNQQNKTKPTKKAPQPKKVPPPKEKDSNPVTERTFFTKEKTTGASIIATQMAGKYGKGKYLGTVVNKILPSPNNLLSEDFIPFGHATISFPDNKTMIQPGSKYVCYGYDCENSNITKRLSLPRQTKLAPHPKPHPHVFIKPLPREAFTFLRNTLPLNHPRNVSNALSNLNHVKTVLPVKALVVKNQAKVLHQQKVTSKKVNQKVAAKNELKGHRPLPNTPPAQTSARKQLAVPIKALPKGGPGIPQKVTNKKTTARDAGTQLKKPILHFVKNAVKNTGEQHIDHTAANYNHQRHEEPKSASKGKSVTKDLKKQLPILYCDDHACYRKHKRQFIYRTARDKNQDRHPSSVSLIHAKNVMPRLQKNQNKNFSTFSEFTEFTKFTKKPFVRVVHPNIVGIKVDIKRPPLPATRILNTRFTSHQKIPVSKPALRFKRPLPEAVRSPPKSSSIPPIQRTVHKPLPPIARAKLQATQNVQRPKVPNSKLILPPHPAPYKPKLTLQPNLAIHKPLSTNIHVPLKIPVQKIHPPLNGKLIKVHNQAPHKPVLANPKLTLAPSNVVRIPVLPNLKLALPQSKVVHRPLLPGTRLVKIPNQGVDKPLLSKPKFISIQKQPPHQLPLPKAKLRAPTMYEPLLQNPKLTSPLRQAAHNSLMRNTKLILLPSKTVQKPPVTHAKLAITANKIAHRPLYPNGKMVLLASKALHKPILTNSKLNPPLKQTIHKQSPPSIGLGGALIKYAPKPPLVNRKLPLLGRQAVHKTVPGKSIVLESHPLLKNTVPMSKADKENHAEQQQVSQYQHKLPFHGIFHAKMMAAEKSPRNLTHNQTMPDLVQMPGIPMEGKPLLAKGKTVVQKPANILTILSLKKAALKSRLPLRTTGQQNDMVPNIIRVPQNRKISSKGNPTNIKPANHFMLHAPPKMMANMHMPLSSTLNKAMSGKQKTVVSQKKGIPLMSPNTLIKSKSTGAPIRPIRQRPIRQDLDIPESGMTISLNKGVYKKDPRFDHGDNTMAVLHPEKTNAFKGMLPPSQGIPDKKVTIDQRTVYLREGYLQESGSSKEHQNLLLRKSLTEKPFGKKEKIFPLNSRVALNKKIMATLEESVPMEQMTTESNDNNPSEEAVQVLPENKKSPSEEVGKVLSDNGDSSVEDVTSVMKSGVSYENGSSSLDEKSSSAAAESTKNTSSTTGEQSLPAVSMVALSENTAAATGEEPLPATSEAETNQVAQSESNLPPAAPPVPSNEDASAHAGPKGEHISIKSPNRLSLENAPLMPYTAPELQSSAPLWGEGDKGLTIYNNNSVLIGGIQTSTNTSVHNRFQPAIRGPSNAVWSGFGYTRSNVTTNSTIYDAKYGNKTNGRGELRRPHIVQWHALPSFPDGPIISRGGVECPCPYLMPYRECQLRCLKGKKGKSSQDRTNLTSSQAVDEQVMKMLHPLVG